MFKIKCGNHGSGSCAGKKFGILPLRLGLGVILAVHGWDKLTAGGTLDMEKFTGFLGSLGIPFPALMAWVVALLEFVGGIALIIGFATSFIATLVVVEFIFILLLTAGAKKFFGGIELDLILLAVALSLSATGGGMWSADKMLRRKSEN